MKALTLFLVTLSTLALEQVNKYDHKVFMITTSQLDEFFSQVNELSALQIHSKTEEEKVEKMLKVFKGQFVVFQVTDDSKEETGFTIYPCGITALKRKLAQYFAADSTPKEIAEYLLQVTENRVQSMNKNTFQTEIQRNF